MRRAITTTASLLALASVSGCSSWFAASKDADRSADRYAPVYSLKPVDLEATRVSSRQAETPYGASLASAPSEASPSVGRAGGSGSDLALRQPGIMPARDANPNGWNNSFSLGFGEVAPSAPATTRGERFDSANVTQVTFSSVGAVFDPFVSPGGEFVVFAGTQHSENSNIYLKRTNSRVVTRLTSDPSHDAMPAISPDGQRIAFCSDRDGQWDIYVMPITGGAAVRITNDASHELHPSWSPDGTKIVFSRLGQVSGRWELWVTDLTERPVSHFLGYGLFPEWCPLAGVGADGMDRIVFQRSRQRGDFAFGIWTIDYKDGVASNETEIASSSTAAYINPTWSPDGRRIAFAMVPNDGTWNTTTRPKSVNLCMIDVDGMELVKLTDGSTIDLMPAWGADNTLYFASDRGSGENLWSLNIEPAVRLAESVGGRNARVADADSSPGAR